MPGRSRLPEIQTDNGPAFKSGDFRRYLAQRGIEQRRTRPHCPEDNGVVERGVRTMKELAGGRFDNGGRARTDIGRAVDYYDRERWPARFTTCGRLTIIVASRLRSWPSGDGG